MKTQVRIKSKPHQSCLEEGEVGYIDGYVRAADERPYAVVVVGKKIDFAMFHNLEVIGHALYTQEETEVMSKYKECDFCRKKGTDVVPRSKSGVNGLFCDSCYHVHNQK